ncbi:prepilin-type N-terminal cleavage/methylation domain-containing protein [Rhodanobacter geophilus]|uniref:Prepilin-type N-terminal cleavage/methylation domain-containing protein n=1 Tax=Rhodanobacter geophilus TaxID=3162488 RepID=A0ABV3QN79_9GAMM
MSKLQMTHGQPRRHRGFTLVELMIAMLLGLIVIGGVISVFLAGQQTYRANEAMGDVGDSSRVAFELLSRDFRGAGHTGCDDTNGRVANVLNNATLWYTNWSLPLQAYDDASKDPAISTITGDGAPVANTSSVLMLSTSNTDASVGSASGDPASFNINAASTQLAAGDIIVVCDFDHATIMQVTSYSGTSVGHASGTTVTPGNCTTGLGYPGNCSGSNSYTFLPNAHIGLLTASDWYIGTNPTGTGGHSLYRVSVTYGATGASVSAPVEMVRNVSNMQISYLQSGGTAFGNAASIGNWSTVSAAQVTLTVQSANLRASVDNSAPLSRQFTSTITLRNRVQ